MSVKWKARAAIWSENGDVVAVYIESRKFGFVFLPTRLC
jgi:hypothetical protein